MTNVDDVRPLRILVAEDDEDHQQLVRMSLMSEQPGAEVRLVATGREMLDAIRDERFDCVVADFNLPDYRASELIRLAAEHLMATPVVIISACRDQSTVIDSFRSGVVDFVPKDQALQSDALWRSVEHATHQTRRRVAERREQERRERHLARLAETDQLTGLYNRRYFERCLDDDRWASDRRQTVSVVMIDIDHFKSVNDTYGHQAGDDVLRRVSKLILRESGGADIAIRWGGEEFAVIRPSASLADSVLWAERLGRLFECGGVPSRGRRVRTTLSAGVHAAHVDEIGDDAIDRADGALYLAKARGRNRVCTSAMVQMLALADEAGRERSMGPWARFERFLESALPRLGPTQREHLTGHAERVATMARQIGGILRLPADLLERIEAAGRLHDLGKCMVPEDVLARPARLTLMERAIVARHADYGAEIAEKLGFDPLVVRFIREHHLRYDDIEACSRGGGEAHVGSRVLCATDALVTMLTCRTYQPERSMADALAEMRREQRRQFDPEVVSAAHFIGSLFSLAA